MDEQRQAINSLVGKKIKDVWLDEKGQIHFRFMKKQELCVPYHSVYDENGNWYRTDFVRFIGDEK